METVTVKKILYLLVMLVSLLAIGCATTIKTETDSSYKLNKWQPILLKNGEVFAYQTKDSNYYSSIISLKIKQNKPNALLALWEVKQGSTIVLSKQVEAPAERLMVASQPVLITEKIVTPFLSTILMNWWNGIDYFQWKVGFKRAVQVEMLTGFMIEVIKECEVAGIKGFQVQLKARKFLMAEACLSPTITLPLFVKRYKSSGGGVGYEVKLLNYHHK